MVTGSNKDMRTSLNEGQSCVDGNIGGYSLHDELQAMLRERRNRGIVDRGRDLNIFRSGSAPPTVEGSLSAVGSLFRNSDFNEIKHRSSNNETNGVLTEDEIRLHPAYLSYYYSHENINPRLPPPMLSKEDWRIAQRFQVGLSLGGNGDWERKRALGDGDSSSLFSRQPGHSLHRVESGLVELKKGAGRNIPRQTSSDWLERDSDGLIGLSGAGLGPRTKSFADILQEGLDQPASLPIPSSRPMSHNDFGDVVDGTVISDCHLGELCNGLESIKSLHSRASAPGNTTVRIPGAVSHYFPSAAGSSLSRSTTPELQLVASPLVFGLPPVSNRVYPVEKDIDMNLQNGRSSSMTELSDIAATLSSLSFSRNRCVDEDGRIQSQLHAEFDNQSDFLLNMPNGNNRSVQQKITEKSKDEKLFTSTNYLDLARKNGIIADLDGQINFPKRTFSSASLYSKVNSSGLSSLEGSSYQNANIPSLDFTGHVPSGYPVNQKLNAVIDNHEDSALSGSGDGQSLNQSGNRVGSDLHSYMEPHGVHRMQATSDYATPTRTAASLCDPSSMRNYISTSHGDLSGFQKAYLETLLAQQKQQYELPLLGKSGGLNQGYYGNSSYGLGMAYPGNPMENSPFPSAGSGNPMFKHDQISRFTSMMRSSMGGPITSWHSDTSNIEGRFASALLEEFKSNKTRSFELSDILDHVVEFSTDQYGSRFIQQKLETATVEEKNKIFPEILPHSRILMTDVFGNYVIQKFFEHGIESQRKALACELTGHVLPLSLQMYGCRVVQKALEVVDVDQQTQMVAELDGSVMQCVRDQNGNHVIQKCIECVPQDRIQFIISPFYGQVVALSTHPYGCRVIQRVLEHCKDSNTQQIIMDEIMQSVCILAHDQYGNYVIQHVLQYGKPHERSAIISKLAGQIVKMSQQKYASNVVEKCLTFGSPEERQLLVNEMLGSIDENEPLQVMMKDPFGNYVVQKLIETCDDRTRQLIVSRIKVHFNTLKRYTYGKHIVTRVEKLIATGERRMGLPSSSP